MLGGTGTDKRVDKETQKSMEMFWCVTMDNGLPKCTKDARRLPMMSQNRKNCGCGTLKTEQGGYVLLAMDYPHLETLDLSVDVDKWKWIKIKYHSNAESK